MPESQDIGAESDIESNAARQRRLQRQADFTGGRLETFRDVLLRHGLPGLLVAVGLILHPAMPDLALRSLAGLREDPVSYLTWGVVILALLTLFSWWRARTWQPVQILWILYLGALSVWEEWVFRLGLPYLLNSHGTDLVAAIVLSNVAFGLMHYFTLRWKWYWCVAACLGGMGLSRVMGAHFDLLLVAGLHWVGTFLNTPRMPGLATR